MIWNMFLCSEDKHLEIKICEHFKLKKRRKDETEKIKTN